MMGDMTGMHRIVGVAVMLVAAVATVAACTSRPYSSDPPAPSCSELLTAAISYEQSRVGDIDSILQTLTENCSDEYEIAVDYLAHARPSKFRDGSCEELIDFGMREEAVALLSRDGHCSYGSTGDGEAVPAAADQWPEGGLGWDLSRDQAGTVQRVCGPLMSTRETNDGTFVNVGRDYPSADRFTFIFWDVYLDPIEAGATICGTGEIYLYDGVVAQMEMWDPGALEIWR